MRKPSPIKGQFIPKSRSTTSSASSNINVGEMLNKLDGEQLTQLTNGVIELANNGMDLAKEALRTGQVAAHTYAEIQKSADEVKKVTIQEETKQKDISQRGKSHELDYYSDTNKEANSHEQIMRILDQVESGKVSSAHLSELISAVKSGS